MAHFSPSNQIPIPHSKLDSSFTLIDLHPQVVGSLLGPLLADLVGCAENLDLDNPDDNYIILYNYNCAENLDYDYNPDDDYNHDNLDHNPDDNYNHDDNHPLDHNCGDAYHNDDNFGDHDKTEIRRGGWYNDLSNQK